jgi:archaellum biogenesis ATPase FlaH
MNSEQSIRATFEVFKPSGVIEVRSMDGYTASGYFASGEVAAAEIIKRKDKTWYFVMNDISESCHNRDQCEKILSKKDLKTTSDADIKRIKWVLVDADPKRPSGISASDDEKAYAHTTVNSIYSYLRGVGFSDPVICDSGNGYHLLYSVDMATKESATTIKQFLQALSMMFSDKYVDVDTAVYNPARITKVYGTMATKGANTQDRPHRQSEILFIPDVILPTSATLLQKVAEIIPEPEKPTYKNAYTTGKFDIDSFISQTGLRVHSDTSNNGVRKIVLEECPFDSNHKSPDSAIFVMSNGAIGFKCFHNSCSDKTWRDVRKMFDPQCYERREYETRTTTQKPQQVTQHLIIGEDGKPKPHFLRLQDIATLDRSKIVSIKTGIAALDKRIIGMNKGELSVWSGGNGSGKSTMLSQIALESIDRRFNVAMFSGELTNNRIKNWMQLQAAGRQNVKLSDNGVTYYVPKAESQAIDEWAADKLWVYNNDYGVKLENVMLDFEKHIENHHTDVVIIDNLMSLDMSNTYGDKFEKQSMLILRLADMAKRYNIHIHFVCHPRKPNGFLRKADISGTADITNAADNVFMMHRVNSDFEKLGGEFLGKDKIKEYTKYTHVIEVMKNRDLGVSDEIIGLYFEPESKRMLNEPHENKQFDWEHGFDFNAWKSK